MRNNTTSKRIVLFLVSFAGALVCTWSVANSCQIKRIEGVIAPLSYVQMLLGTLAPAPTPNPEATKSQRASVHRIGDPEPDCLGH